MSDSYFKSSADAKRREPRNNASATGLSAIIKNDKFKVPSVPSRYATQTLCSNVPPPQNLEPSILEFMKTIGDKLEVVEKLKIIPIEDVKQLSTEYVQKLDSLCMEKIARHLQTASNPVLAEVNENHSVISNAPTFQSSIRSCTCQASAFGSDTAYSTHKEVVPKPVPIVLKPILESSRPTKSLRVLPSDDENESIVSFFKKNQSRSKSATNTVRIKKPVTCTTNDISNKRTEAPVVRKIIKQTPTAINCDSVSSDTRLVDSPVQRKKRTSRKPYQVNDNINITKNSLRPSTGNRRLVNSAMEATLVIPKLTLPAEKNPPTAHEYNQFDSEFFGNASTIAGESFQVSPNHDAENMKISSNKNDRPLHFFSPTVPSRSHCGFSAISTPLPPKRNINNRLKKLDRVAEVKATKPKRIVKNDIVSLDSSEGRENSSSSDYGSSD